MAPLIRNMPRHEAQWARCKSSYMWNKTYYLRRTKFTVYQLATAITGIGQGIGLNALTHYTGLRFDTPGLPDARIEADDFVGGLAFNSFACMLLPLVFTLALFFDLFWPEREEARSVQWTWKLCAATSTVFQLAASLATTVVVATRGVRISGVSVEQENVIRGDWTGPPLVYHQYGQAWTAVALCWIGWLFTLWSTFVMWQAYTHNNLHGPFADRVGKDSGGQVRSDVNLGRV